MTQTELPSEAVVAANALWAQAQGRAFAATLASECIPVLVLKGPEMQARLFGTPAAYPSSDIDVLIHPTDRRRTHDLLAGIGFRFDHTNSVLWRLSGQAMYERAGFFVDLHWGVKGAHLPAYLFRDLERELWRGAAPGPGGMLEPRLEPLLVFLAIHAVGHAFARPEWRAGVRAAARLGPDWTEVRRIARRTHAVGAVRAALREDQPAPAFVLDGWRGRMASVVASFGRGHFLPERLRRRAREVRGLWRMDFIPPRRHAIRFLMDGHPLSVWGGVCPPDRWSTALVEVWLDTVATIRTPRLVETGTGSGALSIMGKRRLPEATVLATDISWIACRNARANARRHGAPIEILEGDLLEPLPGALRGRVDAILAHLPTVPPNALGKLDSFPHAPPETYVGRGQDGLDTVRRLLVQAPAWLSAGGRLIASMREWQWRDLEPEIRGMGFRLGELRHMTSDGVLVVLVWDGAS